MASGLGGERSLFRVLSDLLADASFEYVLDQLFQGCFSVSAPRE
jgi:hypothetical protein